MKKRIFSFVMCVLMLMTAFVMSACSDDDSLYNYADVYKNKTNSSNAPMTICIYSIKQPGTTDAAIELVEEKLSEIAIRRYNTTIDLILIEEEEYAAMMFSKIKMAINSYNTDQLSDKKLTPAEKDEIMKANIDYFYQENPENSESARYPYGVREATNLPSEVLTGTLDIFLVYNPDSDSLVLDPESEYYNGALTNFSMFDILYGEQALAPLKSYLDGSYSAVKGTAYTHAMSYVTRDDYKSKSVKNYFGVPNNYIYGNYDYVIFNKDYVERLFPGADKTELASQSKLNALVEELEEKKAQGAEGFDYDVVEKTFSSYEEYIETANTETFAVGYISGGKSLEALFGSHATLDIYTLNKNMVTDASDYCDSMFCISRSARSVERCLEVLTLINTNKEFRNILQYGVEGIHYTQYSDDEVIPITGAEDNSKYFMDMKYTGNMFLLYPSSDMDAEMRRMSENNWQIAKDQIIDLVPKPAV